MIFVSTVLFRVSTSWGRAVAEENKAGLGHNSGKAPKAIEPNLFARIEAAVVIFLRDQAIADEVTPAEIGALGAKEPWRRKIAIEAAATAVKLSMLRRVDFDHPRMGLLIDIIAAHSDNDFGRCAESTERLAALLNVDRRTVERNVDQAIKWNLIRRDLRPGFPSALSLRYERAFLTASSYAVMAAAVPRSSRARGRPSLTLVANNIGAAPDAAGLQTKGAASDAASLNKGAAPDAAGGAAPDAAGGAAPDAAQHSYMHALPRIPSQAELGLGAYIPNPPNFVRVTDEALTAKIRLSKDGKAYDASRTLTRSELSLLAQHHRLDLATAAITAIDVFVAWQAEGRAGGRKDTWLKEFAKSFHEKLTGRASLKAAPVAKPANSFRDALRALSDQR